MENQPFRQPRIVSNKILFVFLLMISLLLTYYKIIDFEPWAQVVDLYSYHAPLYLLADHPHLYRYIITYPGLYLSEFYGEQMFSMYVSLFFAISALFFTITIAGARQAFVVAGVIAMAIVHAFMNGRGAISWCGWLIAIYVITRPTEGKGSPFFIVLVSFALLASSVSSGTFAVTFSALAIEAARRIFFYRSVAYSLYLAPSLYLFYGYFALSFEKNLDYYRIGKSNPVINMLSHGLGGLIAGSSALLLVVLLIGILSPFLIHALSRRLTTAELIILLVPIAGGMFGYTTLTLAIPSIIIIASRGLSADSRPWSRSERSNSLSRNATAAHFRS